MSDTDRLMRIAEDVGEIKTDVKHLLNSQTDHESRLRTIESRTTSVWKSLAQLLVAIAGVFR